MRRNDFAQRPVQDGVTTASDEQARPLSILVVEDHRDGAESLALLLQIHGYRVVVANSGEAALESAALAPPDVALLDLRLPGMDGWEVARQLRERSVGKRPLLIAVTGCGQEGDYRRSAEVGIDLHLLKPVDPGELLAVLDRFSLLLASR
jgi:CheY-like chemotaxis protein